MIRTQSKLASCIAMLFLAATPLPRAAAQEQPPFIVRIVELTGTRYMCTVLTPEHQVEQLTSVIEQFKFAAPQLRRGPATDEDLKRVAELLQEPELRNAGTSVPRTPFMVMRDGKFILVLGRVEGKTRVVQFNDIEGKKSVPSYLKDFEAFAEGVRRRKLPKSADKGTPNCSLPMR